MAWSSISLKTAGQALLAIWLLAALPAKAQTKSASYEWFPVGSGFRSPVADPTEPRALLVRLNVKRDSGQLSAASADLYKGNGAQLGFDFVGSTSFWGMRPTGGIDVKWLEAADWRSGTSAKIGLMLGRFSPDRRGFTIFLEAYDGFAPFGQFFM